MHYKFSVTTSRELEKRLNWLRAGVSGANDGVVSVSGVVIGVAAATDDAVILLVAAVAAIISGAVSMAGAEYTSVSAGRDAELGHGRKPEEVAAHPWLAAIASSSAFTVGSILPTVAILGPWIEYRLQVTVIAVVLALALTGWWAARMAKSPKIWPSIARNVTVSVITMGLSYAVGTLLRVTVG